LKKILLACFSAVLTTSALSYDLTSFEERSTDKPISYFVQMAGGMLSGLLWHEAGHISGIEYSGGDFVEFGAPYSHGVPTLWVSGSKSQVSLSSMSGNNSSHLLANYILNKDLKESAFLDGVLAFSLINPLTYSLDPDGVDYDTASNSSDLNINLLRLATFVPAVSLINKALTGDNKFYEKSIFDIGVNNRYIRISNTGLVRSNQRYWIDGDGGSADVSFGLSKNDYSIDFGQQVNHSNGDNYKYLAFGKKLDLFKGQFDFSLKLGKSKQKSANLNFKKDRFFFNYDSFAEQTTIGATFEF